MRSLRSRLSIILIVTIVRRTLEEIGIIGQTGGSMMSRSTFKNANKAK